MSEKYGKSQKEKEQKTEKKKKKGKSSKKGNTSSSKFKNKVHEDRYKKLDNAPLLVENTLTGIVLMKPQNFRQVYLIILRN